MKSLRDKNCLITGAASGIGRATAIAAARDGARLFLSDVNVAGLDEVTRQIRDDGGTVLDQRRLDVADHDAVCRYADELHRRHGSMDVLMNIAGISIWGSVETLEHRHWRSLIDINLMGPIHIIESFVPAMIRAGRGGHLVNVSSAAGLFGLPWHAAYSASKFGLRGVSEVLRFDLRRHRIGVSLVCPGGVDTGLVQTLQIAGVDTGAPDIARLRGYFRRHAVSPERAAAAILTGVRKRRYLVFTSFDVRFGHWWQRKFAWPYELVMRLLNDLLHKTIARERAAPPTPNLSR